MIKLYLDWNVISNLNQEDKLVQNENRIIYKSLKEIVLSNNENLIAPYTNGHLNDLMKSYQKGERERVQTALEFISEISNNICLTQYWDNHMAIWHQRNPIEHFKSLLEEDNKFPFESLDEIWEPLKEFGITSFIDNFKNCKHNINFSELENVKSPIVHFFNKSKADDSLYSVMEDLFDIIKEIYSTPTVYNELRSLFKEAVQLDQKIHSVQNVIETLDTQLPKTMLNKSFTELYHENNKTKTSKNEDYSRIIGTYLQLDFVGYSSDKLNEKNQYHNLFNDALHCFYGAHCDYFLTEDKKTIKKSKAVYQNEGIATLVLKPKEFINLINENTTANKGFKLCQ